MSIDFFIDLLQGTKIPLWLWHAVMVSTVGAMESRLCRRRAIGMVSGGLYRVTSLRWEDPHYVACVLLWTGILI